MQAIKVKAPGKLMLFGEYAVLYGSSCIVTAVGAYVTVTASKTHGKQDVLFISKGNDERFLRQALATFRSHFGVTDFVKIETESSITGYGLGSSSAVTVATIRALATLFKISVTKEQLFAISYEAVLAVQKTGSGFDVASCIWGGTILFDGRTKKVQRVSDEMLPFLIVYSGKKGDTVSMVRKVDKLRHEKPQPVENIFSAIQVIIGKSKKAIINKEWSTLGRLCSENQKLLHQLDVSTPKLDRLINTVCSAGAYGAKISGAGGGDCVIVCTPQKKLEEIKKVIIQSGGRILDMSIGVKGVL